MTRAPRPPDATAVLGAIGLAAAVAVGLAYRLQDPLSSSVLPAEDPYTHLVRVREHVASGTLTPLNALGGLYPPGMHAFLAAAWVFSGVELYTMFRFMPTVLGGIGVLGMGVFVWRFAGPVGGFSAALAYAMMPEVVHRSVMMAPTAADVAVVPFLLLAVLEVVRGRLEWVVAAVPLALFVVFAHPWVFGLLGVMGVVFLGGVWLASRVRSAPWGVSPLGLAFAIAIVGSSVGLVSWGCSGFCGLGFERTVPFADVLTAFSPFVIGASFLPLVVMGIRPGSRFPWEHPEASATWSVGTRLGVSGALAGVLVAVTRWASRGGFPNWVDLPHMLGWPVLALAGAAFVAVPFVPSLVAVAGAALAVATYPLVVFNPLDSAFWPHRTVVYLAMGLAMLVGVAGRTVASAAHRAWGIASGWSVARPGGWVGAVGPVLAAGAVIGGALAGGMPGAYEGGWYRLYEPCEVEAFEAVERGLEDPEVRSLVIVGHWRPGVVVPAVAGGIDQLWFSPGFFNSEEEREGLMLGRAGPGEELFVLVERHARGEESRVDASFLEGDAWRLEASWCGGSGAERGVELFRMTRAPDA